MAKAYTFVSCLNTDYVQSATLQELNAPHNPQRHDCKCFGCFHKAVSKLVDQTKESLFDLNDAVTKLDEKVESFHVHDAHQRDELVELRERVAKLTTEQLVCEEKARDMVQRAEKKVLKTRGKKNQARVQAVPLSPISPCGDKEDKGRSVLVPVFGDPPVVSGGAFAALTESDPVVQRRGFKFNAPAYGHVIPINVPEVPKVPEVNVSDVPQVPEVKVPVDNAPTHFSLFSRSPAFPFITPPLALPPAPLPALDAPSPVIIDPLNMYFNSGVCAV